MSQTAMFRPSHCHPLQWPGMALRCWQPSRCLPWKAGAGCAGSGAPMHAAAQLLPPRARPDIPLLCRWDTLHFLTALGLALEVVGYIFRIRSNTNDPYNIKYELLPWTGQLSCPADEALTLACHWRSDFVVQVEARTPITLIAARCHLAFMTCRSAVQCFLNALAQSHA